MPHIAPEQAGQYRLQPLAIFSHHFTHKAHKTADTSYGHGIMQGAGKGGGRKSGIDVPEDEVIIPSCSVSWCPTAGNFSVVRRLAALYGIDHRPLYSGCGCKNST
ncbi:hypothetical protein HK12_02715 [Acetobacter orientalis]|uniref:Uncharacterized protein n=1 Tax=Acetobacter orientalis TaxID=146474 RepID=A0A252A3E4_9PROT|nr:hypothetical protein HK12_02715 [Acetobacter orientalis]